MRALLIIFLILLTINLVSQVIVAVMVFRGS